MPQMFPVIAYMLQVISYCVQAIAATATSAPSLWIALKYAF